MPMSTFEERLKRMGLELPEPPKPVAAYIPVKRVGDFAVVSGQLPIRDGKLVYVGKVGAERTLKDGYEAARLCALNALAALKGALGSLEEIEEIVQVRGFVSCTPEFHDHPQVLNGASEMLVELFGERGRHARAAVGAASLPKDATVEVELVVRVRG